MSIVVVAGESLVDLIVDEDLSIVVRPGGAPFNVARGLARLGTHTAFVGGLSTDRFGDLLRAALADDGVDPRCLMQTDLPTMLAFAELRAGVASYHFYTEGTAAPALRTEDVATQCPPRLAALYVGGLALGLEPIGSTLEFMVGAAPAEALVMLDPNIRPTAAPDADLVRGRITRLLQRCDVVKVSTEDLDWLSPGVDPEVAGRDLLAGGARCALVTDGARDTRIVTREATTNVPVVPVNVIDTVGAGDAYCAGFLSWWTAAGLGPQDLVDTTQLEAAAAQAALVAALSCERTGAMPPTAAEVAEFAAVRAGA